MRASQSIMSRVSNLIDVPPRGLWVESWITGGVGTPAWIKAVWVASARGLGERVLSVPVGLDCIGVRSWVRLVGVVLVVSHIVELYVWKEIL